MKLGGFVIHGNNRDTLGACLDSLLAVCDEVVAVDSCSSDGSAELVRARGVRRVELAWRGYGAARAAAVSALPGCDYLFYLDSDEWADAAAIDQLRAWKASSPRASAYSLYRRDLAVLGEERFVFRTNRRKRLLKPEVARWTPAMIVHEAITGPSELLPIRIDHLFATSVDDRAHRNEKYALLWAVQAHAEGRRPKPASVQRLAHCLKGALIEGGAIRGGATGARLAWLVSRYHARKYQYLSELRRGRHQLLIELYRSERYEDLFREVQKILGT